MGVIDNARRVALNADVPEEMLPELVDPTPYEPVPLEAYDDGYLSEYPPHDLEAVWASDEAAASANDPTPEQKIRAALLTGNAIKDIPPPEPLIAGLLDRDSLAALYAPPATTKSFVAISWSLCVATATWWLGREVHAGPVLYVVAEGASGIGQRVTAWQDHERVRDVGRMHWVTIPVNLRAAHWVAALGAVVAELEPVLVVIDTLSQSMVGGDENSAKDMTEVIDAAGRIRRASGACVLLVHHVGKSQAAGLRGHSSLLGALDTAIEVTRDDDNNLIKLEVTKQKNHAEKPTIRLQLAPVPIPCPRCGSSDDRCRTCKGTGTVSSAVITPYRGAEEMPVDDLPEIPMAILRTLGEVDTGAGVSSSVWLKSLETGVAERTFYRWRARFLDAGLCQSAATNGKGPYSLTEKGSRAVAATTATDLTPTATRPADPTAATATPPLGVAAVSVAPGLFDERGVPENQGGTANDGAGDA